MPSKELRMRGFLMGGVIALSIVTIAAGAGMSGGAGAAGGAGGTTGGAAAGAGGAVGAGGGAALPGGATGGSRMNSAAPSTNSAAPSGQTPAANSPSTMTGNGMTPNSGGPNSMNSDLGTSGQLGHTNGQPANTTTNPGAQGAGGASGGDITTNGVCPNGGKSC